MPGMKEAITSRTYDLWSKFYDHTFGALVVRRQWAAVAHLPAKPGDRVLDLGVGTGMTLPHYPRDVEVVGLDLSPGMLAKAARRCRQQHLEHCQLVRADAMFPPFAPQSFDHIVICHTISVVSDPRRLLAWAKQMVRPGGSIVVLNHFQSTQPVMATLERWFNPIFVKIGWRSDLALEEVLEGSDLTVTYSFKLRYLDLWRIVVLESHGSPTTAAGRAVQSQPPAPDAAPHADAKADAAANPPSSRTTRLTPAGAM